MTSCTMLLVGGTFDTNGGRPSGYFGKLAHSLQAAVPEATTSILNGGSFAALEFAIDRVVGVTHLLWFADVPNDLPKLLPILKSKYPGLVLVSSKNNRKGLYTREALQERMRRSRSEFLVEFTNGEEGKLVGSVLGVAGQVYLESSPDIDVVAGCLAEQFGRLARLVFPLHKTPVLTFDSGSHVHRDFKFETEVPLDYHVGAFGVERRHHVHEGVDLYGKVGDEVCAMEAGTIVGVYPFTGVEADSPWWADTQCVLVRGASGVLNYGEVSVEPSLKEGSHVQAGERLGQLVTVLRTDKGRPMTMLHIERYTLDTTEPLKMWEKGAEQPVNLCDPTTLLLKAQVSAITEARPAPPRRKRVCIIGKRGQVSQALQERLRIAAKYDVSVVSSDVIGTQVPDAVTKADLLVLCTLEFSSPGVLALLPATSRVLDVSPAFRTSPGWVYGMPELPGAADRIIDAQRVANPGCFASAAILALEPLVRAGLLDPSTPLYLDGSGGYTTGGSSMVSKMEAGELGTAAVYGLSREHRHVVEIKHVAGLSGSVAFSPKIVTVPRGIRMEIPLFHLSRDAVLAVYEQAYAGTTVQVDREQPSRIPVEEWAGREGACLRAYDQDGGCRVVCTLDNLGKGAVDTAFDNINLMLG